MASSDSTTNDASDFNRQRETLEELIVRTTSKLNAADELINTIKSRFTNKIEELEDYTAKRYVFVRSDIENRQQALDELYKSLLASRDTYESLTASYSKLFQDKTNELNVALANVIVASQKISAFSREAELMLNEIRLHHGKMKEL